MGGRETGIEGGVCVGGGDDALLPAMGPPILTCAARACVCWGGRSWVVVTRVLVQVGWAERSRGRQKRKICQKNAEESHKNSSCPIVTTCIRTAQPSAFSTCSTREMRSLLRRAAGVAAAAAAGGVHPSQSQWRLAAAATDGRGTRFQPLARACAQFPGGAAWRAAGIPASASAGAGAASSRGCRHATEPRVASGSISRHPRTLHHQSSAGFATTAAAADNDSIDDASQEALTRIKHEFRELLLEHGGTISSVVIG
jgi:hypothetical protein